MVPRGGADGRSGSRSCAAPRTANGARLSLLQATPPGGLHDHRRDLVRDQDVQYGMAKLVSSPVEVNAASPARPELVPGQMCAAWESTAAKCSRAGQALTGAQGQLTLVQKYVRFMADHGSVSPPISQGETGCALKPNIHFPLQSPCRVLNVWNANTVPLAGDHPVIPVFRKEKAPCLLLTSSRPCSTPSASPWRRFASFWVSEQGIRRYSGVSNIPSQSERLLRTKRRRRSFFCADADIVASTQTDLTSPGISVVRGILPPVLTLRQCVEGPGVSATSLSEPASSPCCAGRSRPGSPGAPPPRSSWGCARPASTGP